MKSDEALRRERERGGVHPENGLVVSMVRGSRGTAAKAARGGPYSCMHPHADGRTKPQQNSITINIVDKSYYAIVTGNGESRKRQGLGGGGSI